MIDFWVVFIISTLNDDATRVFTTHAISSITTTRAPLRPAASRPPSSAPHVDANPSRQTHVLADLDVVGPRRELGVEPFDDAGVDPVLHCDAVQAVTLLHHVPARHGTQVRDGAVGGAVRRFRRRRGADGRARGERRRGHRSRRRRVGPSVVRFWMRVRSVRARRGCGYAVGLGPGGGGRGAGARSKAVAVALVALDLSLRARVDRVGTGGGSQRGVRDGRVNRRYEGADGEGGKEINGRGGAPRGRARGGRVARTPTRTPSTPRTEPSTRSVGLVERGDAPGSRWRRPPSPPLSSGGCCRTAWAPPHPRCRRMSTTRRCPARVAGCATRTYCSRGSSRAGRGFLCAAWSAPNVARGAVWREFQEIFQVVITEIKQLGF